MILEEFNKKNRVQSDTYLLYATPLEVDYNFVSNKISKKNQKIKIQNWVME